MTAGSDDLIEWCKTTLERNDGQLNEWLKNKLERVNQTIFLILDLLDNGSMIKKCAKLCVGEGTHSHLMNYGGQEESFNH